MLPTPADQEDRLALLAQPEWNKLLRHFELSHGYALIILMARDSSLAGICFEELNLWLLTRGRPALHKVSTSSPHYLEELPDTLLSLAPPPGPVWAQAVGTREAWEPAWKHCAARLNLVRDGLAAHFSTPLLLVGPPWIRELLRDNAPDLWSVRSFVADLSAPRNLPRALPIGPATEPGSSVSSEFSPDPDLAVSQAARLRGVPGQERVLSEVLDRAAQGLVHRGRSEEALPLRYEALALDESSVLQEPNNSAFLRDLSASYNKMGDLQRALGNGEQAQQFFSKALEIRERLVRQEPSRADYLRDLSVSFERLATSNAPSATATKRSSSFPKPSKFASASFARNPLAPTTSAISPFPTTRWAASNAPSATAIKRSSSFPKPLKLPSASFARNPLAPTTSAISPSPSNA